MNSQEIAKIAQQTTVQVNHETELGGSGVIIAKQNNTYTILTAKHVVKSTDDKYTIRTYQERDYPVTQVMRLETSEDKLDLAVVAFDSTDDYSTATLGDSDQSVIGADIYVAGYPLPSFRASEERNFTVTTSIVSSRPKTHPRGYTLRYDATTRKGMSGGPIFDIQGRVIGIHGLGDVDNMISTPEGDFPIKTGFNAGIPINRWKPLVPQTWLNDSDLRVNTTPTGDDPAARLQDPQQARDYYARGLSRLDQGDNQGAIEDFKQAIKLDPNLFEFKSIDGSLAISRKENSLQGIIKLWQERRTSGWTTIKPFTLNNQLYFLSYKEKGGDVTIERLNDDLQGTTKVWQGSWMNDWTIIEPFTFNGQVYLFSYKDMGKDLETPFASVPISPVNIDRIKDDLQGTRLIWPPLLWTSGWTIIKPFTLNGQVYLFSYKGKQGTVAIDRINDDLQGIKELWRGSFESGWTMIEPITLNAQVYLYKYIENTGTVAVDRINDNLQGVTKIQ